MLPKELKMISCRPNRMILMIKCHLSRVMGEQRLKISDLSRDTRINRGTLTRMHHETLMRIELDTIKILYEYLSVSVGELLEYQKARIVCE